MRADFNVPLDKETSRRITSDTRIRKALPTVRAILEQGCSLVLASHLGRPNGKPNPRMSLAPVAARLSELLGRPVATAPDCVGPKVEASARQLRPGEILLLENLRFHGEEQANDEGFSNQLASLADVYVNDAFGTAHRAHASTVGVTKFVPERAAGLLIERELKYLSMAVSSPIRPYIAIIGGAKISGKIDVIRSLLRVADRVLIGGAMTYTFLRAQGVETGKSLVEKEKVGLAVELLAEADGRIVLPRDHVIAEQFSADAATRTIKGGIPAGWMGLDIGPETVRDYADAISSARMIVWNGPMGVFELEPFAHGTISVARAIDASCREAIGVVGGGDSERAIRAAGAGGNITHISTGGGASLDFLAGNDLPALTALE